MRRRVSIFLWSLSAALSLGVAACATDADREATSPPSSVVDDEAVGQSDDDRDMSSDAGSSGDSDGTPERDGVVSHGAQVGPQDTGPTAYFDDDLGRTLTYDDLSPSDSITTTEHGQVIERLDVRGQISIAHDDVVIRAVRIRNTGSHYSISYQGDAANATIEYVEIDGGGDPDNIAIHLNHFTLRYAHIYDQSTGVNFGSGSTIEYSYVHSQALKPGSHNAAMSIHGGSDGRVRFNNLVGSTSAALSLYARLAPLVDIHIEGNLFNGGSYCTYAGAGKQYGPQSRGIRYIDNLFGRDLFEQCGRYGPYAEWDGSQPGNEWINNRYEDGRPL